jgi:hypothetical protein
MDRCVDSFFGLWACYTTVVLGTPSAAAPEGTAGE